MLVTMMKIRDNSVYNKAAFSELSGLTSRIADKTLEQLEKEGVFVFPELLKNSDDLTKDEIILQSVNDTYRTSNVMGYLGYGDKQLFIGSRFSKGENDFFLRYMLSKVLELPNIVDFETNANNDETMFNILVFLFPRYLMSAMRKGLFKTYIRNRYNDENVKGTIDVPRHISKNTPFIGKIAYSQREYSYDNFLMELVRHTIEYIKKKPYGKAILLKSKDEVNAVTSATPNYQVLDRKKVISDNQHNMIRHAYYREYRALQQLCLLILQNRKHKSGSGANRLYGILFDGAWLWEEYINTIIGKYFHHPRNKTKEGKQYLFEKSRGEIYPDFISKNSSERIIADAKYKPIKNIGREDYYQLLAYMFRFDARKGLYIFPKADDEENLVLRLNSGSTYENNIKSRDDIYVVKQGLCISAKDVSFEEFKKMMKFAEKEFLMCFKKNDNGYYGGSEYDKASQSTV
ncbi:MAG: hypothetical protein J5582_12970 [Ruminococcus sp.]|nr:hypothetical protein [Ruminococcus sp.]